MLDISLSKENNLKLKLNGEYSVLKELKDYFTKYAPGYIYHPKYKAGVWNGKVCVMDVHKRELPYGLLYDILKFKKKNYPDEIWTFSNDVKNLFNGPKPNLFFDLKYQPRDYQKACVEKALEVKKGIFLVGTGRRKKSNYFIYLW